MSPAGVRRRRLGALLRHSAARFATVGVLNTVLTAAVIFGLKATLGIADAAANAAGYAVGLACSFALNRRFTFGHQGSPLASLGRFAVVCALAYAINLGTVLGLIGAGLNDYLAHLAGMPLYTAVSYLGCRYFVFAPPRRATAPEGASTPANPPESATAGAARLGAASGSVRLRSQRPVRRRRP